MGALEIQVDSWDIAVLVLYFLGVIITGFSAMFASKRGTITGFFLAGRFMGWLPIGASLFASNIGSEHFIGLAGSGAASGIGVAAFELNASLLLQLLGWVFLPVYIASGAFTLPDYMSRRFGGNRIQVYLAGLSLLLYIFTKISVNLYSGSLFLTEALRWNLWISILFLLGLTSLITVTGGLAAVLYTDTMQFFVMIIGAMLLAILSFIRVGGFSGLLAGYGHAIAPINATTTTSVMLLNRLANVSVLFNGTASLSELSLASGVDPSLQCSLPSTQAFRLLRGVSDPDMPWLGFLLGQTPASIWYWCADQMMVQRALAAKSLSHAQGATLLAGLIKQLPLFIIVIPGMISRMLFPDVIACTPGEQCLKICGQRNGCSNLAYPKLVVGIMPSGLRGLMLAVMSAALISDLTSIFNSASTLFAVDIYKRFRSAATDWELTVVGRIFVMLLVVASIAWVPVIQELQGSQLFIYIQAVCACLAPPVAAVYLLAILSRRCTERGAFYGLLYGLIVGLIRLILTIIFNDPACGEEDRRPWIVGKFHYMYFALFSFLSTSIVMLILSLLSPPPTAEQVHRLTYWTAWDAPMEHQVNLNDLEVRGETEQKLATDDETRAEQVHNSDNAVTLLSPSADPNSPTIDTIKSRKSPDLPIKSTNQESNVQSKLDHTLNPKKKTTTARRCIKHLCLWFCGCEERPCMPEQEDRLVTFCCCGRLPSSQSEPHLQGDELHEFHTVRLQKIISLKQNPCARLGLRIGLLCIVILSVFGFVFFSLYFDLLSPGPLPVLLKQNSTIPASIAQALDTLQHQNLVRLIHFPTD